MKIQTLIKQARKCAKFRGHNLAPAKIHYYPNNEKQTAFIKCRSCEEWVQCDTKPDPNGIDIGGPAVALGCKIPG